MITSKIVKVLVATVIGGATFMGSIRVFASCFDDPNHCTCVVNGSTWCATPWYPQPANTHACGGCVTDSNGNNIGVTCGWCQNG